MRTLLVRQEGGRCIDCIVRTPLILWMQSRLRGASIESENPEPEERSSGDQTGIINPNRTFNILCTLTQFKRKQENFSFLCHPDLWFYAPKITFLQSLALWVWSAPFWTPETANYSKKLGLYYRAPGLSPQSTVLVVTWWGITFCRGFLSRTAAANRCFRTP